MASLPEASSGAHLDEACGGPSPTHQHGTAMHGLGVSRWRGQGPPSNSPCWRRGGLKLKPAAAVLPPGLQQTRMSHAPGRHNCVLGCERVPVCMCTGDPRGPQSRLLGDWPPPPACVHTHSCASGPARTGPPAPACSTPAARAWQVHLCPAPSGYSPAPPALNQSCRNSCPPGASVGRGSASHKTAVPWGRPRSPPFSPISRRGKLRHRVRQRQGCREKTSGGEGLEETVKAEAAPQFGGALAKATPTLTCPGRGVSAGPLP